MCSSRRNEEKMNKKSTGFKIKIGVLIVAILAAGTVAAAKLTPAIRRAMMGTEEYYQYVEKKNRDAVSEYLSGYYDKVYEGYTKTSSAKKVSMKAKLSDSVKAMLSLSGVDLSGLSEVNIDMSSEKKKDTYSGVMQLGANDTSLLTLKAYMDLKQKKQYIQIPELSKSYLDTSAGMEDTFEDISEYMDFGKLLPKTDVLVKVYDRYTNLLIEGAEKVKRTEGGCEAEGILQKTDKYTVSWTAKEADALCEKFLKQLKKDEEIRKLIQNIDKERYTSFVDSLEDALTSLKGDTNDDGKLTMAVHIASGDKIAGRTITLSDGEEEIVLELLYPQDGEKFGFTFRLSVDGIEYFNFYGKGTVQSGVLNGSFALDADKSLREELPALATTKNLLRLDVEDYDMSHLAEGKASGTVTYSSEAAAELANYSLRVKSEGDMENAKGTITLLAGKDKLVTIDISVKEDKEPENVKPAEGTSVIYDVSDSEDMLQYQTEMDTAGLLKKVKDTIGIDLSGMLYGAELY